VPIPWRIQQIPNIHPKRQKYDTEKQTPTFYVQLPV
jgi:hypothetical protein